MEKRDGEREGTPSIPAGKIVMEVPPTATVDRQRKKVALQTPRRRLSDPYNM